VGSSGHGGCECGELFLDLDLSGGGLTEPKEEEEKKEKKKKAARPTVATQEREKAPRALPWFGVWTSGYRKVATSLGSKLFTQTSSCKRKQFGA
jgi:hypothetical protein